MCLLISSVFGKIPGSVGLQFVPSPRTAYLIGLATARVMIYLFGLLVQSGMKKRWHALVDTLLRRVPLINTI